MYHLDSSDSFCRDLSAIPVYLEAWMMISIDADIEGWVFGMRVIGCAESINSIIHIEIEAVNPKDGINQFLKNCAVHNPLHFRRIEV